MFSILDTYPVQHFLCSLNAVAFSTNLNKDNKCNSDIIVCHMFSAAYSYTRGTE